MSASITKNVNQRKLNPPGKCALVQVLRAMTSTITGKEYSIIPKVREDGMILHVNAYFAGKGGNSGSPFPSPLQKATGFCRVNLLSENCL